MLSEKFKLGHSKNESSDAGYRGGETRISDEVPVMVME